jgi:shikimate kinase
MNIILIGMRGSGKSSIAKKLSVKLSLPFFDTDRMIEEKVDMTLSDFVTQYGWGKFRDKESEIIEDLATTTNSIISTGGGVILRKKNIENLHKNGKFIFLKTTVETIVQRIEHSHKRPKLTNKKTLQEELTEVWNERKEQYLQNADIIIITDNKTREAITEEIIEQL